MVTLASNHSGYIVPVLHTGPSVSPFRDFFWSFFNFIVNATIFKWFYYDIIMIFHHRTTHFLHSTPLLKRMANPESEWGAFIRFLLWKQFWMMQIWFGYFHFPFLSMWKDHNCHLCGERVEMGPLLTKRYTTSNMAKATSSTSTAFLSLSIT